MSDKTLLEALEALRKVIGTKDDPNIGWRGTKGKGAVMACEWCDAMHEDCTLMEHTANCPVPGAFAAIAAIEQAQQAAPSDLHAAIMNLPCNHPGWLENSGEFGAYSAGHAAALHAAAELVSAQGVVPPGERVKYEALAAHAIEELCQLGYTVKDGELIPPDNLHELARVAGFGRAGVVTAALSVPPVAAKLYAEQFNMAVSRDWMMGWDACRNAWRHAAPAIPEPARQGDAPAEPVAWRFRFHTDASRKGAANDRPWVLTDKKVSAFHDMEAEPLFIHPAPAGEALARPGDKFKLGDVVRKVKGSQWHGTVVGAYSTALTPEGYAVESSTERGSVQIYPAAALTLAAPSGDAPEQTAKTLGHQTSRSDDTGAPDGGGR